MTGLLFGPIGLAAMLAATAAAPAPPAGGDIVVTGARDSRRAADEFVERVTMETAGQLARFDAPVCPAALGLPPDHAAALVERVRDVAQAAGAPVAEAACTPNILIVVAADGLEATQALHKLRPRIFEGLTPRQVEALIRRDEPAKAWQVIETRGRDGRKAEAIDSIPSAGGPPRFVKDGHVVHSTLNSRIGLPTRQDLTLSVVLVDLDAAAGRSLRQLADYAAMRTLARTRTPAAGHSRRTILSLFEAIRPVRGLTRWDLAYLKGLYATERSAPADLQRLRIARAVRSAP
jgi:hypothetical protein